VVNGFNCGDADAGGNAIDGAMITATDALQALQAAVGVASCAVCRCNVNISQSITATDALMILRKAVGSPIDLTCTACGT